MTKRKKRPEVLNSKTHKIVTPCGNMYLRFGYDDKGELYEVFSTIGKGGSCIYSHLEAVSRLLCDIFRFEDITDADKLHAIEHLRNINCGNVWWKDKVKYVSCLDFIAVKTMEEMKSGKEKA